MSITFPASGTINNKQWPFSLVMFGTRPNDTASAGWATKGSSFQLADNSGTNDGEMWFFRDASGSQVESRSETTFKVADGQTHIAATVSSSGLCKLYKNGTQVAVYSVQISGAGTVVTDAASDLVVDLNTPLHVAFYSIELTSGEISSLYAGGAGVNCYSVQGGSILVSTDSAAAGGSLVVPRRALLGALLQM